MISTIVFDLDDTLYEEKDYYISGFKAVADYISAADKSVSSDKIAAAFLEQFEAQNYKNTFDAALEKLGIAFDEAFIAELVEKFRIHKPVLSLPLQSKNVLDKLRTKYTLAVVTDGYLPGQRLKIEALGIQNYFKCIIYTEELGRDFWKPSPAAFEKLLKILNVKAQQCVYIGDNARKDFVSPNKLGFTSIQIICPSGIHKKPPPCPEAAPKYVIQNISELLKLLDKL